MEQCIILGKSSLETNVKITFNLLNVIIISNLRDISHRLMVRTFLLEGCNVYKYMKRKKLEAIGRGLEDFSLLQDFRETPKFIF